MSRFDPVLVCCVCGAKIPYMPHEELVRKGLCTVKGDGSRILHCNMGRHSGEEIAKMITASPVFVRASEYGKSPAASIHKPDDDRL